MIAKIGIKVYIVLACINIALRGYFVDASIRSWFALLNMFFLFVILFQEREVFAHTGSKRVLFSADVFAYISIAIGLIGASLVSRYSTLSDIFPLWLYVVFIGLLFYIISVWIFGMHTQDRVGDVTSIRRLTRILTGIAVYIGSFVLPSFSTLGNNIQTWMSGFGESVVSIAQVPEGDTGDIDENVRDSVNNLLAEVRDEESADRGDENIQIPDDAVVEDEVQEEPVAVEDTSVGLTFGLLLPKLVERYTLGPPTGTYSFAFVDQSSPLYDSFAIARDYSMIGTATSPNQIVLCKHMMVLMGLAEGWELAGGDVFTAYWNEATRRGYTTTCSEQNAQATLQDFSSISYL